MFRALLIVSAFLFNMEAAAFSWSFPWSWTGEKAYQSLFDFSQANTEGLSFEMGPCVVEGKEWSEVERENYGNPHSANFTANHEKEAFHYTLTVNSKVAMKMERFTKTWEQRRLTGVIGGSSDSYEDLLNETEFSEEKDQIIKLLNQNKNCWKKIIDIKKWKKITKEIPQSS